MESLTSNSLAKFFYVSCDGEQSHFLRWPSEPPADGVVVARFFNEDGTVVFELGDDFNLGDDE
jgi:hypothetical protein